MNIVDELKITDGVYDEDIYDNIEVEDDSEELLEPPMLNNDSDDSPLESLSKEELIELIGIYSKNWLALDGVW